MIWLRIRLLGAFPFEGFCPSTALVTGLGRPFRSRVVSCQLLFRDAFLVLPVKCASARGFLSVAFLLPLPSFSLLNLWCPGRGS